MFSPHGKGFTPANKDVARLWDVEEWRILFVLKGHMRRVVAVKFSPDGHWMVRVPRTGQLDSGILTQDSQVSSRIPFIDRHCLLPLLRMDGDLVPGMRMELHDFGAPSPEIPA